MTNIKKKKKKIWEFHEFRFKWAIPRIPRLFRDRGKSLALTTTKETATATYSSSPLDLLKKYSKGYPLRAIFNVVEMGIFNVEEIGMG